MWLLLVEDEQRLAHSLKRGLEEEGHIVDLAADGEEGKTLASINTYDALIVDWRLPRLDGRQLIEHLRAEGRTIPVLMLTALGSTDHKIAGLDAGADDYLTKPFSFEELTARLRALDRRSLLTNRDMALQIRTLKLDSIRERVSVNDNQLFLSPKEYALLELLMRNAGAVISRSQIADHAWGNAHYVRDNVIDVTISTLRSKLAEAQAHERSEDVVHIQTRRGVGYYLTSGTKP